MPDAQRKRCSWVNVDDPLMCEYHDREWGVPTHDDRRHFEFFVLEAAQAGLSWSIVLRKREGYRRAFSEFDPRKVARYSEARIDKLTADPGIIRNRMKIAAAVKNARAFLAVQKEFGSFDAYCWHFVNGRPRQNRRRALREIPATTPESDAFSRDLKRRGFSSLGRPWSTHTCRRSAWSTIISSSVSDIATSGVLERSDRSEEFLQHGRRVVPLPDDVERQPHIHIHDWQQHNASGAMPLCGLCDPGDSNSAQDKTQYGIAVCCLLNDAWSAQAAASARLHHLVMEGGIDPAMEPDERRVPKIAQPNAFSLGQRMAFRYGKDHPVQRELAMLQLCVPRRNSRSKARVQSIG